MGWRGVVRTISRHAAQQAAAQRRAERESLRRRRELLAQANTIARYEEQQRAAHEVAVYENYLEVLTSVHKESWSPFDWNRIATNPPPQEPQYWGRHEGAARQAAAAYQPSLTERMLGTEASKRRELNEAIERARYADANEYQAAMEQHRAALASWQWYGTVARGMLQRDVAAYKAVLDYLSPFDDLQELDTTVSLEEAEPDVVVFTCLVKDAEVVPSEEIKLTASGKISTKDMPKGRYWELYQDHVCGCAIRVARDTFALLPVPRVVVNVATPALDRSTGHIQPTTILAVSFLREVLARLNIDACDPSDSMVNFDHRMKFKKTTGFDPVEAITTSDQFVRAQAPSKKRR
jgi:hypothetical protein